MNAFLQQFLGYARRNPILLVSVVIIVAAGSTSYYLWHRQHDLTSQHDEVKRSGEDMLQSLTSHARVTAELVTVKQALEFIDKHLINEGDLAENLGYFYQIETASRMRFSQLSQLSSQPGPADSPYKAVPFALRASGTYRQILRLLHELETGPRQLRIRTYTFTASDTEPDLITMDLNVELLARP